MRAVDHLPAALSAPSPLRALPRRDPRPASRPASRTHGHLDSARRRGGGLDQHCREQDRGHARDAPTGGHHRAMRELVGMKDIAKCNGRAMGQGRPGAL